MLLNYMLYATLNTYFTSLYTLVSSKYNYLITTSNCNLLIDMSESFGLWVLVTILFISSLALGISIQQVNAPRALSIRRVRASQLKNRSEAGVSYKHFLNFTANNF